MLEKFIQTCILILSALAIYLTQQSNSELSAYAPILGLLSQPFWFYETYHKKQWGMFILSIFITYSWILGVIKFWL